MIIEVTMLFVVLLQFVAVIQASYRESGTTIFLDDEVFQKASVLDNVGTCVAPLKSNNKQVLVVAQTTFDTKEWKKEGSGEAKT